MTERRRARKTLEKHPNQINLDDYNRKTAAAKEICSKSKKKFQTYVSTLQYDSPIKTVWSKIKSFKSNYVQQTYPITLNNVMITDPVDKANVLAEFFSSISRWGFHKTP